MANPVWMFSPGSTGDLSGFSANAGAVSIITSVKNHGYGTIKLDTGAGAALAQLTRSNVLADAGRRGVLRVRFDSFPDASSIIIPFLTSGLTNCFRFTYETNGKINLNDGTGSVLKAGSTVMPVDGTFVLLGWAYHVTSVSNFTIKLWVNNVLEFTATQADGTLNSASTSLWRFQMPATAGTNKIAYVQDLYIDDGSDADGDIGNIAIADKRPNANGTNNTFSTAGTSGSGYGTGRSQYVNERPLSTAAGHFNTHTPNASTAEEDYVIEDASTGDENISGKTIVSCAYWAHGTGLSTDQIVRGTAGAGSVPDFPGNFSGTGTMRMAFVSGNSYPGQVGMRRPTAGATDAVLNECGVMIAYIAATNGQISAALGTASVLEYAATMRGAARVSAALATASTLGQVAGLKGAGKITAALATVNALQYAATIRTGARLSGGLTTASAQEYASTFAAAARIVAALASASASTPTSVEHADQPSVFNWTWNVYFTSAATSGTLSAGVSTASALSSVSSVSAGARIAAVTATASATSPASSVIGSASISAVAATASALAYAPSVATGGRLSSSSATVSALAPPASVTSSRSITAGLSTASALSFPSSVLAGARLSSALTTATALSLAATFVTGASVVAQTATASATADDAVLIASNPGTILAHVALANAQSYAAAISGGVVTTAITATATAQVYASSIATGARLSALTSTATALAPAANVATGARVFSLTVTATALEYPATLEVVTEGVTLSALVTTASARSYAATLRGGYVLVALTTIATAIAPTSSVLGGTRIAAQRASANALSYAASVQTGARVTATTAAAAASSPASLITSRGLLPAAISTATARSYAMIAVGGARILAATATATARAPVILIATHVPVIGGGRSSVVVSPSSSSVTLQWGAITSVTNEGSAETELGFAGNAWVSVLHSGRGFLTKGDE